MTVNETVESLLNLLKENKEHKKVKEETEINNKSQTEVEEFISEKV